MLQEQTLNGELAGCQCFNYIGTLPGGGRTGAGAGAGAGAAGGSTAAGGGGGAVEIETDPLLPGATRSSIRPTGATGGSGGGKDDGGR